MITGTGDHLRPEWPITITGMRNLAMGYPSIYRKVSGKAAPLFYYPTTR